MKKRFVIDENWAVCTDGQLQQGIKVVSQTSIYVSSQNKLMATEMDRMCQNFNCAKLINAAAVVGTIAGAIAGAALGAGVGSCFGIVGAIVGGIVGGVVGAISGSVVASVTIREVMNTFHPCFCAMLTKPFPWSSVHERVFPQTPRALMPDATMPCMLGGLVSLAIPDMERATMAAKASMFMYCDKEEDNDTGFDNYNGQSFADFKDYNPEEFGWKEVSLEFAKSIDANSGVNYVEYEMVDKDGNKYMHHYFYDASTGFKAGLYETPEGDYVLVSRGTHNSGTVSGDRDWIDDNFNQAVLGNSDQYDQEVKVSQETRKRVNEENQANGTDSKFITAGHSLAGGTATLGAAVGESDESYVFNPAGVNDKMFNQHESTKEDASHVYTFSSKYDPLTLLNDNVAIAPNASGKRIVLEIAPTPIKSISNIKDWATNGHDLPYLIAAMEAVPVVKVYAKKD